jgi:hypothetical protein
MYLAHRLAWFYVHGNWPTKLIDHINGNKTDNRIANLRDVEGSLNNLNCHTPRRHNAESPYIGVVKPKRYKRWLAKITLHGKRVRLGCFDTAEEAQAAYLEAKKRLVPHVAN